MCRVKYLDRSVFFCPHHHLDNEVYAWGNNSMGQCGQGNSTGPITKPKKVVGLDGVAIQQISAGTSHSLAWTALPRDRSAPIMHWLTRSRLLRGEFTWGWEGGGRAEAGVCSPH